MAVGDKWGGIVAERHWRMPPRSLAEPVVPRAPRPLVFEPNLTYPVVMTFLEDSIKVEYPTLGCAGVLRAESYAGGTLHAREEITEGSCVQGVEVVLKRSAANQLEAEFLVHGQVVAKGNLVRTPEF